MKEATMTSLYNFQSSNLYNHNQRMELLQVFQMEQQLLFSLEMFSHQEIQFRADSHLHRGGHTKKRVTMNVSFRPHTMGIISATDYRGHKTDDYLMCTLIPYFGGESRDLKQYFQRKLQRVQDIRKRKRVIIGKLYLVSWYQQRQLKRLQRGPFMKAKKQEISKKKRANKQLRQRFRNRPNQNLTMISVREGSESPFECPLWNCNRGTCRSRRDDFDSKNQHATKSSRQVDRSRSPISIRSSPRSTMEE